MNFYDLSALDINGKEVNMSEYKDKVVVIVNTASKCGFTFQYKELQSLYDEYKDKGFVILGFPCNQFSEQEPGTEKEIQKFCSLTYNVTFPMFSKIDVNGKDIHPIYRWLKFQKSGFINNSIKWNFTKFLIDRNGKVVKRYGSSKKTENMKKYIESLIQC